MVTNLNYLKTMSGGNKALMMEMIDIFKEQVVNYRKDLQSLHDEKKWIDLGKLAHKTKSAVSIMGMSDLAADMKTLELKAKEGTDVDTYQGIITKFTELTLIAENELAEYYEKLKS
jgi:HPt (histidine-containing phosphotransfer) domain-containing protein